MHSVATIDFFNYFKCFQNYDKNKRLYNYIWFNKKYETTVKFNLI